MKSLKCCKCKKKHHNDSETLINDERCNLAEVSKPETGVYSKTKEESTKNSNQKVSEEIKKKESYDYNKELEALPYILCVVCKFGVCVDYDRYFDSINILKLVEKNSMSEILADIDKSGGEMKAGALFTRSKVTDFSIQVLAYLIHDADIKEEIFSMLENMLGKIVKQLMQDPLVAKFENLEKLANNCPNEKVLLGALFMSESCLAFDEYQPAMKREECLEERHVLWQVLLLKLAVKLVKCASMAASGTVDISPLNETSKFFSSFMYFYYMQVECKGAAMDRAIEISGIDCGFAIRKLKETLEKEKFDWKKCNERMSKLSTVFLTLSLFYRGEDPLESKIEDLNRMYENLSEILPDLIRGIQNAVKVDQEKQLLKSMLKEYFELLASIQNDFKNCDSDKASLRLIKKTNSMNIAYLKTGGKGSFETFFWQSLVICLDRTIGTKGKQIILKKEDLS